MYQPLHLKYRPKNLQELVGQDTIKTTLTNAITSDKIAQAYLLPAPEEQAKPQPLASLLNPSIV